MSAADCDDVKQDEKQAAKEVICAAEGWRCRREGCWEKGLLLHHNHLVVCVLGELVLNKTLPVIKMETLHMNKHNNQCKNYSSGEKVNIFSLLVSRIMASPNPDLSPFHLTLTFFLFDLALKLIY